MAKYQAVKKKYYHPGIGTYTACGITGWQSSERKQTVIAYIPHVLFCKKDAEYVASQCARLNMDISRLSDVAENYPAE